MELTKEYFDQGLKKLVTKKDLEESLLATERRLIKHSEGLQEELARMVSEGFEDVQRRLDFADRVQILEKQMVEIR